MEGGASHPTPGGGSGPVAQPRRVAFAFLGTRGDCQPYIALALGLQDRGHAVMVFSNAMHRAFVSGYGLSFSAFQPERVSVVDHATMQQFGMQSFFPALGDYGEDLRAFHEGVGQFAPDLILVGSLSDTFCLPVGVALKVPVLNVRLQPAHPNRHRLGSGMPSFPRSLGWANHAVWKLIVAAIQWRLRALDRVCEEVLGCACWSRDGIPISTRAYIDVLRHPPRELLGNPRLVVEAASSHVPRSVKCTGYWVLDEARQRSPAGREHFGGGAEFQALAAFLGAGPAPVCMGWGSMIPKSVERLVLLACGAAMRARVRAVVVGGGARLSMETLRRAAAGRRPELVAYAEANVFFAASAPHEWLFPRCACTVHHGGSGTTAAALRAGVPTLVAPFVLDQHDYADIVQELGTGLRLPRCERLSEAQLSAAIGHVCSSARMRQRARELGRALRAEDGVANAVKEIETVLALHDLGEFRTHTQRLWERQGELAARGGELRPLHMALALASGALAVRRLRRPGGASLAGKALPRSSL